MADGKDSPLRGGTHARIKLHVADQEAKKAGSYLVCESEIRLRMVDG